MSTLSRSDLDAIGITQQEFSDFWKYLDQNELTANDDTINDYFKGKKIKDKVLLASKSNTVQDPEIGLNVQLDPKIMKQGVSVIELTLTMQQGPLSENRTYQSIMRLTRKKGDPIDNENLNLIFPFVDPDYLPGQHFRYELDKEYFDQEGISLGKKTIVHDDPMISEAGILDYYKKEDGTLSTKKHEGPIPARPSNPATLQVSEMLAAKDGFGARISWAEKMNPYPYIVHVQVKFKEGKGPIRKTTSQVDLYINHKNVYKPKFLPITFMVPFPRGKKSKDKVPHNSFSVELFDHGRRHVKKEKYGDIRKIIKDLKKIKDQSEKIIKGTIVKGKEILGDAAEGGADVWEFVSEKARNVGERI